MQHFSSLVSCFCPLICVQYIRPSPFLFFHLQTEKQKLERPGNEATPSPLPHISLSFHKQCKLWPQPATLELHTKSWLYLLYSPVVFYITNYLNLLDNYWHETECYNSNTHWKFILNVPLFPDFVELVTIRKYWNKWYIEDIFGRFPFVYLNYNTQSKQTL